MLPLLEVAIQSVTVALDRRQISELLEDAAPSMSGSPQRSAPAYRTCF
jgi:hypothetical protein